MPKQSLTVLWRVRTPSQKRNKKIRNCRSLCPLVVPTATKELDLLIRYARQNYSKDKSANTAASNSVLTFQFWKYRRFVKPHEPSAIKASPRLKCQILYWTLSKEKDTKCCLQPLEARVKFKVANLLSCKCSNIASFFLWFSLLLLCGLWVAVVYFDDLHMHLKILLALFHAPILQVNHSECLY